MWLLLRLCQGTKAVGVVVRLHGVEESHARLVVANTKLVYVDAFLQGNQQAVAVHEDSQHHRREVELYPLIAYCVLQVQASR
eukprot:scaffold106_cov380-Prasinococcus_capsulatus_cf.AAC.71